MDTPSPKKDIGPHWNVVSPNGKHMNVVPQEENTAKPVETGISTNITLICTAVCYYSYLDEELFFAWIKNIPSVVDFKGRGKELYLYVKSKKIPQKDLSELIALFSRYNVDMKQLHIFLNSRNKAWFYENKKAYWRKRVFGSPEKIA
jgi:hypothetical protein